MSDAPKANRLLDAVDRLTIPTRHKVIQDGVAGTKPLTSTVVRPPLLVQLETAITGTIGIGGSGSLKHERNMLDADALRQFMVTSATVKDWARMVGARVTPADIGGTLRAWYVAYMARTGVPSLEQERFYVRQMGKWADAITAKLQPPRTLLLDGRCPSCGADTWWSKATHEEYKYPLVVEYQEEDRHELVEKAKAFCRACEQVWGVRELQYQRELIRDTPEHFGLA